MKTVNETVSGLSNWHYNLSLLVQHHFCLLSD